MNYRATITEMSAKIDRHMEKERDAEKFVSKRLHMYALEILYKSYITEQNAMNVNIGEGIVEIALIIAGTITSNYGLVDYNLKKGSNRTDTQRDLDGMWNLVPEAMKNKTISEILDVLEVNRQRGFKQTLIYLGIN